MTRGGCRMTSWVLVDAGTVIAIDAFAWLFEMSRLAF